MSHQERNGVRAAYIHKAEHLEERRLMLVAMVGRFSGCEPEKGYQSV
ncbi:hypothetical protein CXJ68_003228 [Escherichia coli]|nr:hypothetical protein [Escherichia coli]EFA7707177.1 hypothetical protein [Escherichia coli]EHE8555935.1 hypothetical protein [Escherichia coli]